MIIGFLIQILVIFVSFFIQLLPVIPLPTGWIGAVTLFWGYVNALNFLFPVTTLLTVLLIALSFHLAILLLRLALWIIHLLRGR